MKRCLKVTLYSLLSEYKVELSNRAHESLFSDEQLKLRSEAEDCTVILERLRSDIQPIARSKTA